MKDLMEKFVRVRIVQANAMDLSLFQFDYDLTFAAFFMNADKTIYGRFGTRSSRDGMRDISLEAFRAALAGALEVHEGYPANRESLRGKRGPAPRFPVPEKYPSLRQYGPEIEYTGQVVKSCMHCHQVLGAERGVFRSAGEPVPDEVMFPWPMPDVVGLSLDREEKATVTRVADGSAAARAGFRPGDELLALDGQPILSVADVQWVLHNAGESTGLSADVRRGESKRTLELALEKGWRRRADITWRVSTWDLRRMGTGGLVLEEFPADERARAALAETSLALRVKGLGKYPPHDTAKRVGFKEGDVIVSFDGNTGRMSASELIAYTMQQKRTGDQVPVTVLRGGERVKLELPMK